MPLSGRALAAIALVLLGARADVDQQAPTFRGGVSLVAIDVTILDEQGRPVPDLTAGDFEIELDGKAQPIRAFAFVSAAPAAPVDPAPKPSAPAVRAAPVERLADAPRRTIDNSAAAAAPSAPAMKPPAAPAPSEQRTFVILIDDLSFSPTRGKLLWTAAARFVDRVPASDPIGFTTTSGIGALNPTRDRLAVRAALEKVVGQFSDPRGMFKTGPTGAGRVASPDSPLGINESIDIERGDDRLLKDVIVRECLSGDSSAAVSMSVAELIAKNQCASDVRREARHIAALIRQNKLRQIDGIKSVIDAMGGAEGIRHLVLISDGLPVSREVDALHSLVRTAAQAGVQLSVLMADPDISLTDEGRGESMREQTDPGSSRRRREDDLLFTNGLQTMTDMLGGTFYRVIGTPDRFFERVLVASSAVYRLGVELPPGAKPGDVFDVSVSVKRRGVQARANRLSVAAAPVAARAAAPPVVSATASAPPAKPRSPESIEDALTSELRETRISGGVPIRAAVFLRRTAGATDAVDISISVAVPAASPGPIRGCLGLMDQPGGLRTNCGALEDADGGGHTASFLLPLAAGNYRLRYAVMDAAGAIGSIELPVRARLEPLGPFVASDVLTWYVAEGKARLFGLDELPRGVDTLRASLELYGDTAGEPPVVRWTLTPEGGAEPIVSEDVPAQAAQAAFRADAAFPAASLAPGRYVIRAGLLINGEIAGTRAAVIRR